MEPIKMTRAEYEAKYGQAPDIETSAKNAQEPFSFGERLKMSFGSPETIARLKEREAQAGLRGIKEVGDIADIAGSSLPVIGGGLGAYAMPFAPNVGAGIGSGLGELSKQAIGKAFGVNEFDLGKAGITGVGAGVGSKFLGWAFDKVFKSIPNKFMATIFKQSADDIAQEVRSGGTNLVQSEEVIK